MKFNNGLTKLILGTVQFGLPYGINNSSGQAVLGTDVQQILNEASAQGIQLLDSAEVYGDALEKIGKFHSHATNGFEIISKFSALEEEEPLAYKVKNNLRKANCSQLYAYLFHDFNFYHENPALLYELNRLKEQGLVQYSGVSIYTNDEFEKVINDPLVDLIQFPFNLLDNFSLKGDLMKKAREKGKILHIRSVFLQGLFFKPFDLFPEKLKPLIPKLKGLDELRKENQLSWGELGLAYPLSFSEIKGVLIGVDSLNQFKENLEFVKKAPLDPKLLEQINNIRVEKGALLNPANW